MHHVSDPLHVGMSRFVHPQPEELSPLEGSGCDHDLSLDLIRQYSPRELRSGSLIDHELICIDTPLHGGEHVVLHHTPHLIPPPRLDEGISTLPIVDIPGALLREAHHPMTHQLMRYASITDDPQRDPVVPVSIVADQLTRIDYVWREILTVIQIEDRIAGEAECDGSNVENIVPRSYIAGHDHLIRIAQIVITEQRLLRGDFLIQYHRTSDPVEDVDRYPHDQIRVLKH